MPRAADPTLVHEQQGDTLEGNGASNTIEGRGTGPLAHRAPRAARPACPLFLYQVERRAPLIARVRRTLPLALALLQRHMEGSRAIRPARDHFVMPEQPPPRQLTPERRFDRPRPRRPLVVLEAQRSEERRV